MQPPLVHWKCDSSLPAVADDCRYADAKQGHEGDCFLVAAMALLAQRGATLLRSVVRRVGDGGDGGGGGGGGGEQPPGQYVVRLWERGRPLEVKVDGLLPYVTAWGDDSPLYTHCRRRAQACFGAIEKAFVVMAGGAYHSLDGGNTAEALHTLTGCAVEELDVTKQKLGARELGEAVGASWARGDLVACGHIDVDPRRRLTRLPLGLRRNHAYAVVGATAAGGVTLYNPMGIDDGVDAGKLREVDGAGTLRMSWAQFAAAFNRVQLCALSSREALPAVGARAPGALASWSKGGGGGGSCGSAGGCTNFPTFHTNPMLVLPPALVASLAESGAELEVQLGQADQRAAVATAQWEAAQSAGASGEGGSAAEAAEAAEAVMAASLGSQLSYPQLGLTVIAFVGAGAAPPMATPENYVVAAKSRAFLNRREVSLRFSVADAAASAAAAAKKKSDREASSSSGGAPFLAVVPSTFYAGQEAAFWCAVRSARALPCEAVVAEEVGGSEAAAEAAAGALPPPADRACWRCMGAAPSAKWEGLSAGNTNWLRLVGGGGGGGGSAAAGRRVLTIFVRQSEEQREKQLPIGAWVLLVPPEGEGGAPTVLNSLAKGGGKGFVKATQMSLRVTVPEGRSLGEVAVVPCTFEAASSVQLAVTLVADGGAVAAGATLTVRATAGSDPAKLGVGAASAKKGGRSGKGGGSGGRKSAPKKQPKPSFGKAKANITAMGDMFAGLE